MNSKIKIGIADDHQVVREGLVMMLKSCKDISVEFEVSNGKELLKALKQNPVDLILLDIAMPVHDGIHAMKEIADKFPTIKIIVISAHSEPQSIVEYVNLGAASFLPKNCTTATLIQAIQEVYRHGQYFDADTRLLLKRRGAIKERKLTKSEQAVLTYLCQGKTNEEISDILKINIKTTIWYKHFLLAKTNTKDIPTLVQYARINGLF